MEKLRFETPNLTAENITKLAELFPGVVADGKVNVDLLRSYVGEEIFNDEAYEFTWVGKRSAIAEAGRPIRKTLRPCVEESKDWDTTENLYIEGDNLDVLKLLQESYLGKVKMVYIDPPYNTGKDSFLYSDDFMMETDEYDEQVDRYDESGNLSFKDNDINNPRFHSVWCSMMYTRLVLARNILADDGFIFISIDDNEASQLRIICDEVFGSNNYENTNYIQVRYAEKTLTQDMNYHKQIEQVLIYRKSAKAKPYLPPQPYDYEKFFYSVRELKSGNTTEMGGKKVVIFAEGDYEIIKHEEGFPEGLKEIWATGTILNGNSSGRFFRDYLNGRKQTDGLGVLYKVFDIGDDQYDFRYFTGPKSENATKGKYYQGVPVGKLNEDAQKTSPLPNFHDMAGDFGNIRHEGGMPFNGGKKPVKMIRQYLEYTNDTDYIAVDFFSGSASTAHAVMQLNATDGGKRKFIMVQYPEECAVEGVSDQKTTICDIGKERIRRAGDKIKEEAGLSAQNLDIGFRVFKLDETNMNDVYYAATETTQEMLSIFESNIKPDRTDMDLLFGCLLDWGLPLSMPHSHEVIDGATVHTYNDGDLIACFAERISDTVVKEIAKRQPLRAVFRDSSFTSSPEKINVAEIFKLLAPNTTVKVI